MSVDLAPRLAPTRRDERDEFHTHDVPAVLDDQEIPPHARMVFARVPSWFWTALFLEVEDFRDRKAHGTIRSELAMSYGLAKDVDATVERKVRKP